MANTLNIRYTLSHQPKDVFLSLTICKELGLVHKEFPFQMHTIGTIMGNMHTLHSGPLKENCHNGPFRDVPNTQPEKANLFIPERPKDIPFTPLEENTGRLKEWLLQHFSSTTFNTNRNPLPVMEGKPHHIHLKPDAIPVRPG